jgi:hypothetical protein
VDGDIEATVDDYTDPPSDDPQKVIDDAHQGDTVLITLRGPASDTEIAELKTAYGETYPGIEFEFQADGLISAAEIVNTNG